MFASATAAAKYLQDSAKSATSSADSVLQQARGIVKANTDKFYAKCSHCNSPLSVYGNLTSHNKCRICCQLFCDKCIVKSSFDIPFAIVAAEYKDKEPGDVVVTADKNKGSNPKGGIDSDSLSVQSSTDAVTTEADAITASGTEDKPRGPLQLDGSSSSSSSSVTVPVTVTVPAAVPAAAPASAPAQSKKNVDRPRYICKHKCLLFARHVCMEAFKHEMTKKLQENFDDFLTSETRQNCYYPLPSKAPEDTAYRKAIRAAYLAEYVVDYVGLGTTYKALKYAYYGSEMFNIIASNGMLPIFAPLLEAMREFGITGPTALLRLYYLGCLHTLRDKINNAPRFLTLYAEAAHQPGVLCEKCPEPVLSYISQYLSPAHWMYLSSLPPPHNQGNEWGSWYLSQLIRRQGWTLLYCMNSSSQIPDGSKCPAFALLARCRRRSAVNSEDEAGRFGNPISPPPYAYSSSTGSRDEFGVGVSRGGEVGPDREVPIGVKRGVEGGPPYYDQEEEEEELVREALLVVRGSQSTMDWSINLQETIGDFDYLHIVDPADTAAAVDTTGTADLTDMSSDLKDNPGIAGGGCRDSAGGSAGELRVSVVPGQVHEGIRAGALGILEGYAMRAYLLRLVAAGYRLKTVGHSLGAGVAVLIAAELRASIIKQNGAAGAHAPRYLQPLIQSVNSVVFACPACVSVNLAEAFLADKLLINTVLDSDIVSRFSFKTLEHLVTEIQDPAFVELSSSWMAQDKSRLTRYAASLGRASEIRSEAASLAAVEAEAAGAGFTGNITSPGVGAGTGTTGDSAEEDGGRDNESASEETSKEATQAPPKPPAGGGTAAAPASSRAGKSSGGLLSFIGSGTSNIYSFGTTTATTTKAAATTKATRIDAAPSGRAATSSITPPDRKENNVSMQTAKGGGGGGGGTGGGGGGGGGGGTAPAMVTSTPVAGKPALVATAIYPPTAAATVKGTTVNADTAFDGNSGSVGGGGSSSSTVGDPLPSAPPAPIVTGKPLAVVFAEEANAPPGTSCAKATPAAGASASPRAGPSAGADAGVDAGTGAGAELKGYGSSEDDDDEGGDDDDDDGSEDDQDDTVKRSAVEKMKGQLADGDKKKKSDSKKDKVSKKMKKRTEAKIKAKKKKERVWTVCPGPIVHLYKEVDGTIRSAVVTHEHRVFQRMTLLPSKLLDDHLMQNIREGVRSALYSSTTPSLSATAALAPSASALTSTSTADASNQPPPKHEDCLSLQVPTTGTTVQGSSLNQNSAALEQQCPSQGNVADGARSRLVGAAAYFSAEVLATTPSRHGYKRPSIRSADGGRSTDGGDGGGGSDHLLSTRQHHASRQSIQDLRGYSASNTTSKDSAASRAKDIYSSFPCFHSPHLQLPPALAAAGTSGSHQEQEKLSKLHRQKTADGEQTLHPQQQEKQEKTAETKVVVEGVEARHWTSCGVCGIDVTWPYVLNSDAARARNAHHCGICGKVVCTLCSPAGDKLPGDGVNQYYELHDLRLAVPELGRFTPQRVCLLCYFDT